METGADLQAAAATDPAPAFVENGEPAADRIVAAAYQLMSEHGLDGVTVRAVLERTGINRRVFYESFAGKDELVLAVFEKSLQLLAAQCREGAAAIQDPLERLRYIVSFIVLGDTSDTADQARSLRRGAALCREHMRLAEARPRELRLALRPLTALLAEQIAGAIRAGQVRAGAPERLAALVYNLVSTTMHAEVLDQEAGEPHQRDRLQLADEIWAFCLGGIALEPARA